MFDGRPRFNDLLFGRREPSYVAFDVLFVDGEDVRALPLTQGSAGEGGPPPSHAEVRAGPGRRHGGVPGGVRAGVVAKTLADAYDPGRTKWWKILNKNYSQKLRKAELFERRRVGWTGGMMKSIVERQSAGVAPSFIRLVLAKNIDCNVSLITGYIMKG